MIAPASLAEFNQALASPSSNLPGAQANGLVDSLANGAGSFQDILAQVTQVSAQSTPESRLATSFPESSWAMVAGKLLVKEPAGPSPAAPAASGREKKANAAAAAPRKASEHTHPQPSTKQERTHRTPSAGSTSEANDNSPAVVNAAATNQVDVTTNNAANTTPAKKTPSAVGSQVNGMQEAAINALGGTKEVSGAAFVMHITPGSNQDTGGQNSGSNGDQSAAAPTSTSNNPPPADPSLSDVLTSDAIPPEANSQNSNTAALVAVPMSPSPTVWTSATPAPGSDQTSHSGTTPASVMDVNEISAENSESAPQTVRTIQVQLTGEGDGRVDLRLVEHAGGLSVSVRTSDDALTKGLQENLPELSARLAAEKYQTHTFVPAASEVANAGSSSTSSDQSSSQSHDQPAGNSSYNGDRNGGQQQDRQQQDGQPQQQEAAWWRQIAALGKLSSSVSNSVFNSQSSPAENPPA